MQDEINISEDVEGHVRTRVEDAGDEVRVKLDEDDVEGHIRGR